MREPSGQSLPAFRDLWIEGFNTPLVNRAAIYKAENEHEKASLFVASRVGDFDSMPGSRCQFSYGIKGNERTFTGYVAEVIPSRNLSERGYDNEQEITALGPSMIMKGNRPRFFTDVTVPQAIKRIVGENSLGFKNESMADWSNSMVWRSLAQTSETDWEMAVKLADRIGCHLVVQRGVVRLIDYNDIAFRMTATHNFRMLSELPQAGPDDINKDTLTTFVPVSLSSIDPTYRIPTIAYMEGGTAVLSSPRVRQGPVPKRFATDLPVRTRQEADLLQQGYYYPEWAQTADLNVAGDASIEPATVISVYSSTRSAQARAAQYDGLWYVKTVRHGTVAGRFTTAMTLGRPPYRAPNVYQPIPFWFGDRRGVPDLLGTGSGKWISTWR